MSPEPSSSSTVPPTGPDIVPYPPELVDEYRAAGYWGPRTIADEFRATAEQHPDELALRAADVKLTYAELDRLTDVIAVELREQGLSTGDRVLFQVTNCPWAVIAWYAVLKAGLVPICTLPNHRIHELSEISQQAEPAAHLVQLDFPGQDLRELARETAAGQPSLKRLLTIHGDGASEGIALEALAEAPVDAAVARAAIDAIQAEIGTGELAVLQLSGGTTSIPKLIPRLHAEYWYNSRSWAEQIDLGAGDEMVHLLPVIHNAGIVCALHATHSRGACFSMSPPDAAQFEQLARGGKITHILLVRPIAQLIAANPGLDAALGALRVVIWADKKLSADVRDRYETSSTTIIQMFGMGEGMCLVTPLDAPAEVRHQTNGAPLCELDEVRVLRTGSEEPVELGEPGELCCRGPYTIRGYYRAAERNRQAFTSDGFYRTGDIVVEVELDGRRWYSLEDRLKDLINRGGEKINAAEIEEILGRHPGIGAAALVAMPDDRLGERACAFVEPSGVEPVPSLDELRRFFNDLGVAKYKWPERIEVRERLPRTNVQKVNKVALRTEVAELVGQPSSVS